MIYIYIYIYQQQPCLLAVGVSSWYQNLLISHTEKTRYGGHFLANLEGTNVQRGYVLAMAVTPPYACPTCILRRRIDHRGIEGLGGGPWPAWPPLINYRCAFSFLRPKA